MGNHLVKNFLSFSPYIGSAHNPPLSLEGWIPNKGEDDIIALGIFVILINFEESSFNLETRRTRMYIQTEERLYYLRRGLVSRHKKASARTLRASRASESA